MALASGPQPATPSSGDDDDRATRAGGARAGGRMSVTNASVVSPDDGRTFAVRRNRRRSPVPVTMGYAERPPEEMA